jgi:hypothetical protein
MAIDFPNSPTTNDTYSYGGKTWIWTGVSWKAVITNPIQGVQGLQGTQGTQGVQGIQGTTGIQGALGIQGPIGSTSSNAALLNASNNFTVAPQIITIPDVGSKGLIIKSGPTLTATITNAVNNGSSITYTANNTFAAGQSVSITGISPTTYNISGTISTAFSDQFTITVTTTTTSYVSGGTATVTPNGNLIEWQNSAGTTIGYIGPTGSINFRGSSTFTSNGRLYIQPASDSNSLIVDSPPGNTSSTSIIRGATSQTADLTQWQNSTGAVQLRVNSSGQIQPKDTASTVVVKQTAAKSAAITAASTGGGIVTYTTTNTFVAGETVTITGIVSTGNTAATAGFGFNLTGATILSASATQFTVTNALSDTYTSGGSATTTSGGDIFQVQDSSGNQFFRVTNQGTIQLVNYGQYSFIPNLTLQNIRNGFGYTVATIPNGIGLDQWNFSTQVTMGQGSNDQVRLIVKGGTSATNDIQQWQTNSGTVLAKIDASGNLTANNLQMEVIPIDNLTYVFDGIENRFLLTWQGIKQAITNPFRLLITLNGIIQSVSLPEYVWGTPFSYDGLILDSDGYMSFSEVPPIGTTFVGRIEAGTTVSSTTYSYPFKAMDILLGAY